MLERIAESGAIFFARSDDPWVLSGANVHISFVGQDDGTEKDRELDGQVVETVNPDLTTGVDVTWARRLRENQGIAFMGDIKVGPFDIDPVIAARLLAVPNPDGRSNGDVVRPWANGADVTGRPRGWYVVDFGLDMNENEAALYEAPFEYARQQIRPFRMAVRQDCCRRRWWIHHNRRPEMSAALARASRCIVTPATAKHRLFAWFAADGIPDHALIVFARDDDYTFGVLHSRVHEAWALAQGTQLETRPRYTPTTCFETFPFPRPTDEQREAIATAARELVRLRDGWLNPPGLDPAALGKRTLTNLYNARPTWLEHAHAALDTAVLAAYGWPPDLTAEPLLAALLALNLARDPA